MIGWWLFMISEWVLVVKYLALTYVAQPEVSQAGKLTRRIIFEHRHRDRQRLICSHTCWWLLMICTMSTQWRISCIWLSALIPGCELINHRPTISSCLRRMITACFQHLAGHLTGRSFDWLIVLSNNYLGFFDQVINPCRSFSSCFLWMLPIFGRLLFAQICLVGCSWNNSSLSENQPMLS